MRPAEPRAIITWLLVRYSKHFYSLDALRGLAALSVIFYHWRHFFYTGTTPVPFDEARQPLYSLFKPLYTDGWRAVDLFFSLSGFIFYWLYSEQIAERTMQVKEFVVLRFSRLYPLHLVTLLFVAVGQAIMLGFLGTLFIYPNYDLYHFVLNLFFASAWGFEHGLSFNGPTWSISVEVFLYALFFTVCFLRFSRWWWLALIALLLSSLFVHIRLLELSRGTLSFFVGGIAYKIFSYMWQQGLSRFQVFCLIALTGMMWIFVPMNLNHNSIYELYRNSFLHNNLLIFHKDIVGEFLLIVTQNSCEVMLFPSTILTLAVCEALRGTLGKRLAFLGNISYSVYLLHFPLQMVFMFITLAFVLPRTIYFSPWMLLGFFGLLIPLSLASYHFLERPAQKILRQKLLVR